MKIMTLLGTRPEIIRLSRIIPLLDSLCDHTLVFSGQNYSPELSTLFFQQLSVREPDHSFQPYRGSTWGQIGHILHCMEQFLLENQPDRVLILGDTNTSLCAMVAKRMGFPVFHMEAGNRCYDDRVPEEVNRRAIDHASDILLPYTNRSRDHLLREGFHPSRILVTGNPIFEVMQYYATQIDASTVLDREKVSPSNYILATLHRAENVNIQERLIDFMTGLEAVSQYFSVPVLLSLHPHTRKMLAQSGRDRPEGVLFLDPPGFFDFVHLEKHALAVLSDSGTVQEETCILGVPAVTLRDVTERPETLECGSNILSGSNPKTLLRCLGYALEQKGRWTPPAEYLEKRVSTIVAGILLGHQHKGQPV